MKKLIIFFLFCIVFSSISYSQSKDRKYHAFSGTIMIGVEAGTAIGFTDYNEIKPQILGRGVLEYFFPTTSAGILSLKAFMSAGYIKGADDTKSPSQFRSTVTRIGGGLAYTFSIQKTVFPYIFAGASYGWINPRDVNDNDLPYGVRPFKIDEENYHAEAGIRFLLSDAINLNFNVGAEFSPNDNWDAVPPNGSNDFLMHGLVGLSYSFFTKVDDDNDGVPNDKDQCPETPQGVIVDDFGCPVDSDGDGVPDYLDKCPNTKAGMKVDESGCVIDADEDGVPDSQDKCPNTPAGMKVNELGCPDTDGDGVFDNSDKCPDTPKGAPVDESGCPKDSDNDGVPDFRDECPSTPANIQVDEKGCAKADTVVKKITLEGDTNFEFNKAELLPSAYSTLNNLAGVIKDNPETRWRVEGHTDAVGSDSYNMELSRKRAQSVVDYLLQQGVQRNRLEVVPLGESQPIATNETNEGRAMNRRVEIKLIEE